MTYPNILIVLTSTTINLHSYLFNLYRGRLMKRIILILMKSLSSSLSLPNIIQNSIWTSVKTYDTTYTEEYRSLNLWDNIKEYINSYMIIIINVSIYFKVAFIFKVFKFD